MVEKSKPPKRKLRRKSKVKVKVKVKEFIFNPVDPWAKEGENTKKCSSDFKGKRPEKETIIKALEISGGHTDNARKMFTYPDGKTVPLSTFHGWMTKYDIIKYPQKVKVSMARNCLNVMYQKAVLNKDIRALENILNKWGRFIDFEDDKDSMELSQLKACKVLYDTYEEDE